MSWVIRMVGSRLMVVPPEGPHLSTTSILITRMDGADNSTSRIRLMIIVVITPPNGVEFETWVTTLPSAMTWGDTMFNVSRTSYGMCVGVHCEHKAIRGDVWLPEVTRACEMEFDVGITISVQVPREIDEVYEIKDTVDNQLNISFMARPVKYKNAWYFDGLYTSNKIKAKVVFDDNGKVVSHTVTGAPDTFVAIHPYHW